MWVTFEFFKELTSRYSWTEKSTNLLWQQFKPLSPSGKRNLLTYIRAEGTNEDPSKIRHQSR